MIELVLGPFTTASPVGLLGGFGTDGVLVFPKSAPRETNGMQSITRSGAIGLNFSEARLLFMRPS